MKNLFIIGNEKISKNSKNFFSANIDFKTIIEGLSNSFNLKVLARKFKYQEKFSTLKIKRKEYESSSIRLNSLKSRKNLGWKPKYNFENSVNLTYVWYNQYFKYKNFFFSTG